MADHNNGPTNVKTANRTEQLIARVNTMIAITATSRDRIASHVSQLGFSDKSTPGTISSSTTPPSMVNDLYIALELLEKEVNYLREGLTILD